MYSLNFGIVFVTLAVGLTSLCCRGPKAAEFPIPSDRVAVATPTPPNTGVRIEFPELVLTVEDVESDNFDVTFGKRTATIKPRTLEIIDGNKVRIEQSQITGVSARIRFDIGFLQYLTDDVRASPLDLAHQTGWTAVDILNNEIQLPQFYKNKENVIEVYKQLGFQSEQDFLGAVEAEHLKKVKAISYRLQKEYFTNLVRRDRSRYEQCCPEIIKQAEQFLSRPLSEFSTFERLGIEIYLQKLTLEIDGFDKAGKPLKFSVIETN